MGHKHSKKAIRKNSTTNLNAEDRNFLQQCYAHLENDDFSNLLSRHLDEKLATRISKSVLSNGPKLTFEEFSDFYIATVLSCHFERSTFITNLTESGSKNECKLFLESLLKSYWKISDQKRCKRLKSWTRNNHCELNDRKIQQIVDNILESYSEDSTTWLLSNEAFKEIFKFVFANLFKLLNGNLTLSKKGLTRSLLPHNIDCDKTLNSLLEMNEILFINVHLPCEFRNEWRLLYSSDIHGESFISFLNSVLKKGPTLLVVQDFDGHKFGSFVSDSWKIGPKFFGSDRCFLFQLEPFISIYSTSGYNDNFMYLNINQQTLPNCLAVGGQFDYFGFCLLREYGEGQSSETCMTFTNYKQLSKSKYFKYRRLEAWRLGVYVNDDGDDDELKKDISSSTSHNDIIALANVAK